MDGGQQQRRLHDVGVRRLEPRARRQSGLRILLDKLGDGQRRLPNIVAAGHEGRSQPCQVRRQGSARGRPGDSRDIHRHKHRRRQHDHAEGVHAENGGMATEGVQLQRRRRRHVLHSHTLHFQGRIQHISRRHNHRGGRDRAYAGLGRKRDSDPLLAVRLLGGNRHRRTNTQHGHGRRGRRYAGIHRERRRNRYRDVRHGDTLGQHSGAVFQDTGRHGSRG